MGAFKNSSLAWMSCTHIMSWNDNPVLTEEVQLPQMDWYSLLNNSNRQICNRMGGLIGDLPRDSKSLEMTLFDRWHQFLLCFFFRIIGLELTEVSSWSTFSVLYHRVWSVITVHSLTPANCDYSILGDVHWIVAVMRLHILAILLPKKFGLYFASTSINTFHTRQHHSCNQTITKLNAFHENQ